MFVLAHNTETSSIHVRISFPDIPLIGIHCEDVKQLCVGTLDVHKATGPDHIPSCLLKEIYLEIAP